MRCHISYFHYKLIHCKKKSHKWYHSLKLSQKIINLITHKKSLLTYAHISLKKSIHVYVSITLENMSPTIYKLFLLLDICGRSWTWPQIICSSVHRQVESISSCHGSGLVSWSALNKIWSALDKMWQKWHCIRLGASENWGTITDNRNYHSSEWGHHSLSTTSSVVR